MNARGEFTLAVAALARAAPREWSGFLEELRNHAAIRANECVQARELVHVAQGRAQEVTSLVALFQDAVKSADRITAKRAG